MRPSSSLSLLLALAAALSGAAGCAQGLAPTPPAAATPSQRAPAALPEWLRLRLAGYDAQPALSAPQAVYQLPYEGGVAYYLRSACCDQPDPLLDADGRVLCHPSGGITGRGDGRCPGGLPPAAQWREVWRHR